MFWLIIGVLIFVGLAFLVLEILVIPGTGVAGIIGFLLMGIGIWQSYSVYGSAAGHYTLAATIVLTVLMLILALRSKTWKKIMLKKNITSKVNVIEEGRISVGEEGKSISRLAPMGKALFGNDYYEVSTSGEFLDNGVDIVIEKIDGNKIFVKRK